MSKGLGTLQREILQTLGEAKASMIRYRGNAFEENLGNSATWRWDRPGWVIANGCCVRLAESVFDLRASAVFLAHRHGAVDQGRFVRPAFQAAFSRSVKGLLHRGCMKRLWLVPIIEYDPDAHRGRRVHSLSDGHYLEVNDRQARFVEISKPS